MKIIPILCPVCSFSMDVAIPARSWTCPKCGAELLRMDDDD